MFSVTFFASFLATFSLASPLARQTSICPWNGVPNTSNFTLFAVSKTDNGVQEPLALGSNGLPDPSSAAWLGSAESIDSIIAKYFVLTDGGITAYGPDGNLGGVSNPVANESGQLTFIHPNDGAKVPPAEVYCELFNTSPSGVEFPYKLAVNGGDSDHFSSCQSTTSDEFIVIYNAVEPYPTNSGYKPETCVEIYIHVLPVA